MGRSMVKLPDSIPVLGTDWPVVYKDFPKDEIYGEAVVDAQEIHVSKDHASTDQLTATIFHEAIHAVLHSSGWHEILKGVGDDAEEGLVRLLEHHLWPIAKQLAEWQRSKRRVSRKKPHSPSSRTEVGKQGQEGTVHSIAHNEPEVKRK